MVKGPIFLPLSPLQKPPHLGYLGVEESTVGWRDAGYEPGSFRTTVTVHFHWATTLPYFVSSGVENRGETSLDEADQAFQLSAIGISHLLFLCLCVITNCGLSSFQLFSCNKGGQRNLVSQNFVFPTLQLWLNFAKSDNISNS